MTIELTSIILGLMTLLGGCGWVMDRRKYKAEVQQKYMDLAKEYVEEFRKNIGEPLQQEVKELRKEVKELKDELENVKRSACYCANCPNRISVLE